ncbi:MAG: methyltransferase domain-containing protein [Reyranella sp.]|nr:methyltransferase domain-containing protein [Reyranella sp.]
MTATSKIPTADAPSLAHDSDELAADYEKLSAPQQFESGKRLAADLGIGAGERVLDVGCGTGLLAEHIAGLVGPPGSNGGHVLGIDPLPLRIEVAQVKARANLAFEVGDANDLGALPEASFDVVILNAVFHWLSDKPRALGQFARVLREGGRIGMNTRPPNASGGARFPMYEAMAQAMAEPPFDRYPRPPARGVYQVEPEEMRALLEAAGFTPTRIEVRPSVQVHATPEAAVRFSEASSFGNLLGHLPLELRPAARAAMADKLAALMTPQGIVQQGRRLVAMAVRRSGSPHAR